MYFDLARVAPALALLALGATELLLPWLLVCGLTCPGYTAGTDQVVSHMLCLLVEQLPLRRTTVSSSRSEHMDAYAASQLQPQ